MSLKKAAETVRAAGRGKDTELVHFTKNEVAGLSALAKAAGGKLTRNPKTGMVEAGFLESMLPTILGVAANFIVPGSGMLVGGLTGALQNKNDPLLGAALGAAGGYGGGQIAAGIQGMGAGAAQQAAMQGVAQGAGEAAVGQGLQTATLAPGLGLNPAVAPSMVESTATGAANQAAADATTAFAQQPFYEQAGAGLQAAAGDPSAFLQGMGGAKSAMQSAGMAAAPAILATPDTGGFGYDEGEASEYNYDAGYTGGTMTGADASSERDWFDPTFTKLAGGGSTTPKYNFDAKSQKFSRELPPESASKKADLMSTMIGGSGIFRGMSPQMSERFTGMFRDHFNNRGAAPKYGFNGETQKFTRMAEGGAVGMAEGGFVIPADVVSMIGNGSSDAGLEALAKHLGAQPIDGPGDGMSDSIPASIDGLQPAAVARQEAYLTPEQVQAVGGEDKLYELLERVRQQAHGTTKQQRPVRPEQVLT